jgi:nucleotide-binding universal stress UspA family protein
MESIRLQSNSHATTGQNGFQWFGCLEGAVFTKILHANDGSESVFHALAIAQQNDYELYMVSVEEIDYMPELIEEVREETATGAPRFHNVVHRARAMAEERQVKLRTHVVAGHPVRDIVELATELEVDLLVIGARSHSAPYERLIGSRADRLVNLAPCPALIVT